MVRKSYKLHNDIGLRIWWKKIVASQSTLNSEQKPWVTLLENITMSEFPHLNENYSHDYWFSLITATHIRYMMYLTRGYLLLPVLYFYDSS